MPTGSSKCQHYNVLVHVANTLLNTGEGLAMERSYYVEYWFSWCVVIPERGLQCYQSIAKKTLKPVDVTPFRQNSCIASDLYPHSRHTNCCARTGPQPRAEGCQRVGYLQDLALFPNAIKSALASNHEREQWRLLLRQQKPRTTDSNFP